MSITETLLLFRDGQDISVLGVSDDLVNLEQLNVIVIEILAWLKLEHKRELWIAEGKSAKLKPMRLNMQFPWCKLLSELIIRENAFSGSFMLDKDELRFKDDLCAECCSEARRLAFEKYNPEIIK